MLRNHSMASGTSTTDVLRSAAPAFCDSSRPQSVRHLLEVLDDLEHDLGALQLRLEAPLAGVEGAARGGDGAAWRRPACSAGARAMTSSVEGLITS